MSKKKAREELLKLLNDICLTCENRTKSANYCEKCSAFKEIREYGAILWGDKRSLDKDTPKKWSAWTEKDVDFLLKNISKHGIKYVANVLGRSEQSVYAKYRLLLKN